jgi:hypothetical protein
MIIERRLYARVQTEVEAQVVNAQGERAQARLCNLSMGGLSLRGDASLQQLVRQLHTSPGAPFTPIEVEVTFTLPADEGPIPVTLPCRHLHTRRVARDVFELGFKILGPEADRPPALARYIRGLSVMRS